jgi:hypothetical protein
LYILTALHIRVLYVFAVTVFRISLRPLCLCAEQMNQAPT